MNKKMCRRARFIVMITLLFFIFSAYPVNADSIIARGTFAVRDANREIQNNGGTWTLSTDGTLTVSGNGAIQHSSGESAPWVTYKDEIKKVVVNEGITHIQAYDGSWFNYCTALVNIYFPASLSSFTDSSEGGGASFPCGGAVNVYFSPDNPYYSSIDGIVYNKDGTRLVFYPRGRTETFFAVPEGVESIGNSAIFNRNLRELVLPTGLIKTYSFAIVGCSNLENVTIPISLTEMGGGTFSECNAIKNVYYEGSAGQWQQVKKSGTRSVTNVIHYGKVVISFKTGYGGQQFKSISVPVGEQCGELPTPTKGGYTFIGWYTKKDGAGERVESTSILTKDTVLYPHWQVADYTITFDGNGGSVSFDTKTVTYGGTYGELPMATRKHYKFLGWYTEKEGGQKVNPTGKVGTTRDRTLYARWRGNTYKITFDAVGGTVGTTTKTVTYGSTYGELPTPTKKGYAFMGWYTAEAGGQKVNPTGKVGTTRDRTLYARWKANRYKVSFNPNGGSVDTFIKWVTYGGPYGELPVPERPGYTFIGWYTESGRRVNPTGKVGTLKNITLYAKWKAK